MLDSYKNIIPALLVFTVGLCIIPFSADVYLVIHNILHRLPLDSFLSTCEQFGTVTCAIAIGMAIYVLDKKNRSKLVYLALAIAVSTSFNTTLKNVAGRTRPEWSVDINASRRHELDKDIRKGGKVDMSAHSGADHWFWLGHDRPEGFLKDRYCSFPSGHSSFAFVLAAFLCFLYPAGRGIWLGIAVGCALGRVAEGRHFLDDVMIGGAMGWLCAVWVFSRVTVWNESFSKRKNLEVLSENVSVAEGF